MDPSDRNPASVVRVNLGGTGSPMEAISAKFAPLFPSSSSCFPWSSACPSASPGVKIRKKGAKKKSPESAVNLCVFTVNVQTTTQRLFQTIHEMISQYVGMLCNEPFFWWAATGIYP